MKDGYRSLIESGRVSPATREVLLARLDAVSPAGVLSVEELRTLRSVLDRVLPQTRAEGGSAIDLAGAFEQQLGAGEGDGWRYAALPRDLDACRTGLSLLDRFAQQRRAKPFAEMDGESQDGVLRDLAAGRLQSATLDLKLWFEDLRADATRIYVAHPETLARMGYSGIADDPKGFVQVGMGAVEAWEPKAE